MNNRIDQLFKDKLGEHRVAPPVDAWLKVEAGLTKKNSYRVLWRAAAVFILVGLFSAIGIQINRQLQKAEQLAEETNTTNEVTSENVEPVIALPPANEQSSALTTISKRNRIVNDPATVIEQEQLQPLQDVIKNTEETLAQLQVPEPVLELAQEKPVVIEFTLDPLPTRTEVIAKEDTDKGSGILKILDKALDIKNGESDFGSLRNAKNELFALDFRKDKQKRN